MSEAVLEATPPAVEEPAPPAPAAPVATKPTRAPRATLAVVSEKRWTKSIAERICEVKKALPKGCLQKNGTMDINGTKIDYVKNDDLMELIRDLMANAGLDVDCGMSPKRPASKEEVKTRYGSRFEYVVWAKIYVESIEGERRVRWWEVQAISREIAETYALKYYLLKVLQLSGGERDDEAANDESVGNVVKASREAKSGKPETHPAADRARQQTQRENPQQQRGDQSQQQRPTQTQQPQQPPQTRTEQQQARLEQARLEHRPETPPADDPKVMEARKKALWLAICQCDGAPAPDGKIDATATKTKGDWRVKSWGFTGLPLPNVGAIDQALSYYADLDKLQKEFKGLAFTVDSVVVQGVLDEVATIGKAVKRVEQLRAEGVELPADFSYATEDHLRLLIKTYQAIEFSAQQPQGDLFGGSAPSADTEIPF